MSADSSRLTAQHINEQTFARAVRGYAMHEVDEYLDRAAEEIDRWQDALTRGIRPTTRLLTPREVSEVIFSKAVRGYDMGEVDEFLDELAAELIHLHGMASRRPAQVTRWQDALGQGFRPSMRLVTPQDVNEKMFTKVMRGYAMIEVDAFLDELTDEIARLQDQEPVRRAPGSYPPSR